MISRTLKKTEMSSSFECETALFSGLPDRSSEENIKAVKYLSRRFKGFVSDEAWDKIHDIYPVLAHPDFLDQIKTPDFSDPVFKQIFPLIDELSESGIDDPMDEEKSSPVKGLLHRYEDRALLLVTSKCFVHCRHCMRKRLWKENGANLSWKKNLSGWARYIQEHDEIREVILSGGDCLTLKNEELAQIMQRLSAINHVQSIRVHSRALAAAPKRINQGLIAILKNNNVKRFITQFNHPAEISEKSLTAINMLKDTGIKVENQAVLLKGINDTTKILADLFKKLYSINIKPYYLHHPDKTSGTAHFQMDLEKGLQIFNKTRELLKKEETPLYVVDVKGGSKMEVAEVLGHNFSG